MQSAGNIRCGDQEEKSPPANPKGYAWVVKCIHSLSFRKRDFKSDLIIK